MSLDNYLYKQSEKDGAYQQYNYASANLKIKTIECRLAEILSQREPLNSLINKKSSEREKLYAAAYYVVIGRMPNLD